MPELTSPTMEKHSEAHRAAESEQPAANQGRSMDVFFLEAGNGTPMTKHFATTAEGIDVTPYPLVRKVISHRERVQSIDEFYEAVCQHAAKGHCLLKGDLDRDLNDESRAGHTNMTDPTRWLLLDLDFSTGWTDVDAFLYDLNPEWADVSYIWQDSASAGIRYPSGLRGHLILMLDEPAPPAMIKLWLKERNLLLPKLTEHLSLSANGMSLRWGLDITTCQNDKLIYIAPPTLDGQDDPIAERTRLVLKERGTAPVPPCPKATGAIDAMTEDAVNHLRQEADMPRRKPKLRNHHDYQLLENPEAVNVTGAKEERGFVYLNLNGGDSWGYFFPEDQPDILHNFKDEPVVRLQQVAPRFYAEYVRKKTRQRHGEIKAMVFRDPSTDTYYNMRLAKDERQIHLLEKVASKERMKDFMAQYGLPLPDPIPDWSIEFNPTTTTLIDKDKQWVNRFEPTDYLLHGAAVSAYPCIPPTIDKVLKSVIGNDQECLDHFVNWLACLVQTRQHLQTAWVFHGVPGTGKGLLLSRILRPILGENHVTEWTTRDFEDDFNEPLEYTCLLFLDEFKASSSRNTDGLMSRLKNVITEDTLPIRGMRASTVSRDNFVNVIIASNFPDPITLPDNDRRFNVAPAQERALEITTEEVQEITDELWLFVSYLMHYDANMDQARRVLQNHARLQMIGSSQSSEEAVFSALKNGDLDYFLDFIAVHAVGRDILPYQRFKETVSKWAAASLENPDEPVKVLRDDIRCVLEYISGIALSPHKFSRKSKTHHLPMKPLHVPGHGTPQGCSIQFSVRNKEAAQTLVSAKKHDPRRTPLQLVNQ